MEQLPKLKPSLSLAGSGEFDVVGIVGVLVGGDDGASVAGGSVAGGLVAGGLVEGAGVISWLSSQFSSSAGSYPVYALFQQKSVTFPSKHRSSLKQSIDELQTYYSLLKHAQRKMAGLQATKFPEVISSLKSMHFRGSPQSEPETQNSPVAPSLTRVNLLKSDGGSPSLRVSEPRPSPVTEQIAAGKRKKDIETVNESFAHGTIVDNLKTARMSHVSERAKRNDKS